MTTLRRIEDAIRACTPSTRTTTGIPDNPAPGQCDVTALVVHDIFGGELLAADVFRDGVTVEGHMWNRLPGGIELDLTCEQFVDGQVVGEPRSRPRPESFDPAHPRYHRYGAYLVLAERVRERLRGEGA